MAIYHLEAKVIGRSTGRSAVAASAYMSCSKILNDYDGVLHDFTRKRGLVWEHIFLPENAPQEWQDRSELWNAVERTEKTKDSRLARELVELCLLNSTKNNGSICWQIIYKAASLQKECAPTLPSTTLTDTILTLILC
ncbi:MobA/MobL family protein [Ruminococcus sp. JL13D9]|uniref:MobA/MobL family protein n=1 Tax=Ruminococcus sp. JL13D9 TaxID=3233381 RepID=UPI00389AD935